MRTLLAVLLTTGLPFTSCIDWSADDACTALYAYGVSAHVTDANSGQVITNAVLTLKDGNYTEIMQFVPTNDYVGAGERAGNYTLTIEVPGVATEVVSDINVKNADRCHVMGVALAIRVLPGDIEVTVR